MATSGGAAAPPVATLSARCTTAPVPAAAASCSALSARRPWRRRAGLSLSFSSGNAARARTRARLRVEASSMAEADPVEERLPAAPDAPLEPQPQVLTSMWNWKGYNIRYQYAGTSGPALVLIHGFGANSDHWRKNIPVLALKNRVYAIDLIGYGYSDKPNPRELGESFYTFETWGEQLNTFCTEVVKSEAFFICNSIGGLVGLQAAVMDPQKCEGIFLLNISLRMLHISKQPWFGKPFIKSFQSLLRNTVIGRLFFNAVATPGSVKNILCQCYHDTSAVTDELVQFILQPGLNPGAVDVFLEFICYSGGPLPEELLPEVKCPVLVAWGEKDPWEPVELGRAYASFDTVEDFVVLPNVGHCPQDEAPDLVNPLVESFVIRHS
uniref:AB hydrolase-1 domain-containing protein n=1 Tax=Leersia perrieri TaxID=77586 RepID=A0A0D9X0P8_9ORYZ